MLRLRGFGQGTCPGDPSCPGYVAPGSADYQTSLLQEILANQTAAGYGTPIVAPAAAPSTFTGWLNANTTPEIVGAGALLVLAVFMGMGRR